MKVHPFSIFMALLFLVGVTLLPIPSLQWFGAGLLITWLLVVIGLASGFFAKMRDTFRAIILGYP